MRSALLITTSLFCVGLYACSTHAPSGGSESSSGPPSEANPTSNMPTTPVAESRARGVLIGTLVTHDQRVSILGRGNGDIRVVVKKKDTGDLVADGVTLDELRKTDPGLHSIVTNAVAGDGVKTGEYVDATNTKATSPRELGAPNGGQPLHLLGF